MHEGEVGNLHVRARRVVFQRIGGIELDHRVRIAGGFLDCDDVLERALVTRIQVDIVVIGAGHDDATQCRPSTENLEAVVRAVVRLEMIDDGI